MNDIYMFFYDQFQSMNGIIKVLDPEGDGKIHFNEFCQGVRQILDLKSK